MNIDENLHCIWYENEKGDKWFPDMDGNGPPDEDRPDEHVYMHSILTNVVHQDVLMIIRQQDVDACAHDGEMKADDGLIKPLKGRTCRKCQGYQCVEKDEPWPVGWKAVGSVQLVSGSMGWDEKLVMAMTRPTQEETNLARERELERRIEAHHGDLSKPSPSPKLYRMFEAILVSARSCERCWNALLWQYGCGGEKGGDPGYAEESEQWHKCGTSCVFCEHMPSIREGGKSPSKLEYVGPSEGGPP